MAGAAGSTGAREADLAIRQVGLEHPWIWLSRGWADLWRAPGISLTYGVIFTAVSVLLSLGLFLADVEYLLPPLAAGFMLVGPMMAVGLYETSRRLEAGEPVSLGAALFVSTKSPAQLAFIGVLLALFLLAWMRIASLLFALFFGTRGFPPIDEIMHLMLFTWEGMGLLIVGTLVGALLAAAVFSLSAVAVPLLMAREMDAISAMLVSVRCVRENLAAMALWAWLIAIITAAGLLTFYLGLAITFPLVGHATWHAYRDLVGTPERAT
jgi:uncharacterized membrane protein